MRTGPRVGVSGPGGDGLTYPWRFWVDGDPTVSAYRPGPPRERDAQLRRPSGMTPPSAPVLAAPLLAVALLLGACGSSTVDARPAAPSPGHLGRPPTIGAAGRPPSRPPHGPVTGQGTVLADARTGPRSCAWAPSRSRGRRSARGIPLAGWDWATAGPHEQADLQGRDRRAGAPTR